MIAIIDYGVGNLFSLCSSLCLIGAEVTVASDAQTLKRADHLILPGVGAFADAAVKLRESGLQEILLTEVAEGTPLLGICLGMQMLFEKSYEYGEHTGLGLLHGTVRPISDYIPAELKIPHIGWNALHFCGKGAESPLLQNIREGDNVYFVHSFCAADCADSCIATTEYGAELTAAVQKGNVFGTQFHPEKSGDVGLNLLRAFCNQ